MIHFNAFSTDELEFILPVQIQLAELKDRPCGADCPKGKCYYNVWYEQRVWKSDSYSNGRHSRIYEISYRKGERLIAGGAPPRFKTVRHRLLHTALVEMAQILYEAGVITDAGIGDDIKRLAFLKEYE